MASPGRCPPLDDPGFRLLQEPPEILAAPEAVLRLRSARGFEDLAHQPIEEAIGGAELPEAALEAHAKIGPAFRLEIPLDRTDPFRPSLRPPVEPGDRARHGLPEAMVDGVP